MSIEDLRRERIKKLEKYEASGRDPYPAAVKRSFSIGEALKKFSRFLKSKKNFSLVGRLRAVREHGGATFVDIEDASGQIQLYFSRDDLGRDYDLALEIIDIGDFLEINGSLFNTKKGEPTIKVLSWRIISKSIRPLPEKWHGLKDVEERFRKRYLDILMNPEVRERFRVRSAIVRAVRAFFDSEGFLEVETPMLQHLPGGALAKPFKTHANALDIDLYLRIAPELYLKELLVGGMEKVYELGKSFRNEGIDVTHNPEFTTVEWYAAYWDEEAMMACVERCFASLLKQLKVKRVVFDGKTIVFGKKFKRISFAEALQRYALIVDYERETAGSLRQRARQFGIEVSPHAPKGKIADEIFKKICRPHLVDPIFITHHPMDISPLAKKHDVKNQTVRRLQLVVGGVELVNAYSELNDPIEQKKRFEAQWRGRDWRPDAEEESHPFDEGFIEALEYGMPPAAGAGMGIDRLVMLLTDTKNIREVVLFPTLRPKAG